MKKIFKFLIPVFVFFLLIVPAFSFAWTIGDPVVPACPSTGCGWNEFLTLINNVISFILFSLVLPISALMFCYAGIKLVTSGGSTEARGAAKRIFTNTVIGIVLAAGAWLIINLILSVLSPEGAWTWIGFKPGI